MPRLLYDACFGSSKMYIFWNTPSCCCCVENAKNHPRGIQNEAKGNKKASTFITSVTRFGDLSDLRQLFNPLAAINLPKSPTFLGNLCKGVKIYHFLVKSFLVNFYRHLAFFSGHTVHHHCWCRFILNEGGTPLVPV